jgi:predicted DCC family thiol-disulfide oxidoreductase YuxK
MKRILLILIGSLFLCLSVYAQRLTLVYTGNSYSSLYPCGRCPASVGGGVTRRATTIKNIREQRPNVLVLDAGNLFAGGSLDENSLGQDLDKKRTLYYLEALQKMGYDALCLGEEEFNFGLEFLERVVKKYKLNFISSNAQIEGLRPYIIKEFDGIKVGILGLTHPSVLTKLGIKSLNYREALKKWVTHLKDEVDLIILLSNMGGYANKEIAKSFSDIKVIISARLPPGGAPHEVENEAILVNTSYQAKEVRILNLDIKDRKITHWNFEARRLALDVQEDEEVKEIIPVCFSDKDCREGKCVNPGELTSFCEKSEVSSLEVILITDRECPFCHTGPTQEFLKRRFPQINFTLLDYKEKEGLKLVDKYNIETLPAFILPQDIQAQKNFNAITNFVQKRGDVYFLIQDVSGIFLFLKREVQSQRIDIFITPGDSNLYNILNTLRKVCNERKIDLRVHFFLFKEGGKFISKRGKPELQEIERLVAIRKLYPEKFWDYLLLRAKDMESSWWPDILEDLEIDYKEVKNFIEHPDFASMLEQEATFAQDLRIKDTIAILINNRMLFRIVDLNKEELTRLLNYAIQN